jgi:hypothetical protein
MMAHLEEAFLTGNKDLASGHGEGADQREQVRKCTLVEEETHETSIDQGTVSEWRQTAEGQRFGGSELDQGRVARCGRKEECDELGIEELAEYHSLEASVGNGSEPVTNQVKLFHRFRPDRESDPEQLLPLVVVLLCEWNIFMNLVKTLKNLS